MHLLCSVGFAVYVHSFIPHASYLHQTCRMNEQANMETFTLSSDFIELYKLLQLMNLCGSGGEAKIIISEGLVTVDEKVETRKRCKIRQGQKVACNGTQISVCK